MPLLHRKTGYTAEQFLADYMARSEKSEEYQNTYLQSHHVVECDCDYDQCQGWAMVPNGWTDINGNEL